jgi:hypothetical protein
MYVWNRSAWAAATATANITMYRYTASGGETSKSGADDNSATLAYAVGFEQVYVNGVLLVRGVDYTASTGSSITGLTALVANDVLVVLAFTAFSVANAVPLSTYTAKGDLAVGTGASTVGTLGVGADGTTLVANSSASTGVAWAGPMVTTGKNALINGGFDIWQRGTSATATGYLADRWYNYLNGSGTFAQETSVVPPNFRYALKFTASSSSQVSPYQVVETSNALAYAGKNITVSALVAASTSTPMTLQVQYSTIVDYQTSGTWTNIPATSGGTATPTSTTYVPITGVFAIPSNAQSIRIGCYNTNNIASGVVLYFAAFQMELGTVATAFSRAGGTLQGELAACQRYLPAIYAGQDSFGNSTSTTNSQAPIFFKVTARVAPTGVTVSNLSDWKIYNKGGGSSGTPTAIALGAAGVNNATLTVTTTAGSPTIASGDIAEFYGNGSSGYILFTGCEL